MYGFSAGQSVFLLAAFLCVSFVRSDGSATGCKDSGSKAACILLLMCGQPGQGCDDRDSKQDWVFPGVLHGPSVLHAT